MYDTLFVRDETPVLDQPPTFDHMKTTHFLMVLTIAVCVATATPMVWIRMYVNLGVTKLPRWDDALAVISWFGLVVYCVGLLYMLRYGLAIEDDLGNIDEVALIEWRRFCWIFEMMYVVVICMAKFLVLVLYKRLFVPPGGQRTWVFYSIMFFQVFNGLFYAAGILVVGFTCVPRQRIWDKSVPGRCINMYAVFISSAFLNVISDGFMVVAPVAVILKMQMARRRKIELLVVFAYGLICVVAAVSRLVYSITGMENPDQNVALLNIATWSVAEIASCIITACVPMVPLMARHIKKVVHELYTTYYPSAISREQQQENKRVATQSARPNNTFDGRSAMSQNRVYFDGNGFSSKSDRNGSAGSDDTLDARMMPLKSRGILVSTTISVSIEPNSEWADYKLGSSVV